MVASISTFLVLLRAALRLYNDAVPAEKVEALNKLKEYVDFDPQPCRDVLALKQRTQNPIAGAIKTVINDSGLRRELSVKGQERANEFNWQETAKKTLAVYNEVACISVNS